MNQPVPDGGGDGRQQVNVQAGDLEAFARFVEKELADTWNDPKTSDAIKLDRAKESDDGNYPRFGRFGAATSLAEKYETAHDSMVGGAARIYELLAGLAEASREIAKQYKTTEALAHASVTEIEKVLAENVNPSDTDGRPPAGGTDPAAGSTTGQA